MENTIGYKRTPKKNRVLLTAKQEPMSPAELHIVDSGTWEGPKELKAEALELLNGFLARKAKTFTQKELTSLVILLHVPQFQIKEYLVEEGGRLVTEADRENIANPFPNEEEVAA